MNLQHAAILTLNTRVRRLRYLFKIVDLAADAPVSRSVLIQALIDYGMSRQVYDEIVLSADEPFSGHFFENVAWGYEKNTEKAANRSRKSAERVAETYIHFACNLGLVVETEHRLSASQISLPLRFMMSLDELVSESAACMRNAFTLALLLKFDRDLTAPFLLQLIDRNGGISISDIENHWDDWVAQWFDKVIAAASAKGYGNPVELMRYQATSARTRKNPKRYAEHLALIRFHWFLDLRVCRGEPRRNPDQFISSDSRNREMLALVAQLAPALVEGDFSAIHFEVARALAGFLSRGAGEYDIRPMIRSFLDAARRRGISNVRLSLLDSICIAVASVTVGLPNRFDAFCTQTDAALKALGIMVVRAPRREESYIPTQQ